MGIPVALHCPSIGNSARKHLTQKWYRPWKTGFVIWAKKDDLHFKLLHQESGKISRSWVHTSRLKPVDPRPCMEDGNEGEIPYNLNIHKELEPHAVPNTQQYLLYMYPYQRANQ